MPFLTHRTKHITVCKELLAGTRKVLELWCSN